MQGPLSELTLWWAGYAGSLVLVGPGLVGGWVNVGSAGGHLHLLLRLTDTQAVPAEQRMSDTRSRVPVR